MKKTKVTMINKKIMAILLIIILVMVTNINKSYAYYETGFIENLKTTLVDSNNIPIRGAEVEAKCNDINHPNNSGSLRKRKN